MYASMKALTFASLLAASVHIANLIFKCLENKHLTLET